MNTQTQRPSDMRGLRITAIAVAAVALLTIAAYLFGTGLRADTSQSVARSPLGSSLTAVRESRLDDYYGRAGNLGAAAAVTLRAGSRLDDYYGRSVRSGALTVQASPADSSLDDYFGRLNR